MTDAEKTVGIKEAKRLAAAGEAAEAFARLRSVAEPEDDFVLQNRYAALFKTLPREALCLRPLRLAVLANSTVSEFCGVLRYWLAVEGFQAEIYHADYGTVSQTILDPGSGLYAFEPAVLMVFTTRRDVRIDVPPGSPAPDALRAVDDAVAGCKALWEAFRARSTAHILQNNADLPYERVFGNLEGTVVWGQAQLLQRFNLALAEAAAPGVTVFDLDFVSSVYGKKRWVDARYWYHSKHAFALDATGLVARRLATCCRSVVAASKKCLVLDLDGTLWGGVVADDGVDGIRLGSGSDGEAYVDFQRYLRQLRGRGILLAVCSKNEEAAAKAPFLNHPDMQLKLSDIAAFKANWRDKASNIKDIAAELNLGLDSFVFVYDNPVERALVRSLIPEVAVLELPQYPADFVVALCDGGFFEVSTFSGEDRARTEYYQADRARAESKGSFSDLSGFLASLDMEMTAAGFDDFNLPRVAQLINKSNQFHPTGKRYTEGELAAMRADSGRVCRCYRLKDRFGDNGLISAFILAAAGGGVLEIDTWVMSCRVLSRGVEEYVLKEMVALSREALGTRLVGRYVPTTKNQLVRGLYERLGFGLNGEEAGTMVWELDLKGVVPEHRTFIRQKAAGAGQPA